MTVIKKSGKKEEFSIDKLSHSIRSANSQTDEPIKLNTFLAEFRQIVSGKDLITTQQIDVIVYGLLYSKGLLKTLISFISYDKK